MTVLWSTWFLPWFLKQMVTENIFRENSFLLCLNVPLCSCSWHSIGNIFSSFRCAALFLWQIFLFYYSLEISKVDCVPKGWDLFGFLFSQPLRPGLFPGSCHKHRKYWIVFLVKNIFGSNRSSLCYHKILSGHGRLFLYMQETFIFENHFPWHFHSALWKLATGFDQLQPNSSNSVQLLHLNSL